MKWAMARMRSLRRIERARSVVLCYHRVASLDRDPQLLAVTPQHFGEHLNYLSEHFEPVALERVRDPEPSAKLAVAVTFDDGYADNLIAARPLLEEHRVPATVFVCTGNLGTRREFWWDELERILLEPETLPAQLDLSVRDARITRDLPVDYVDAPAWNVLDRSDPTPRHALYREIAPLIRPLPPAERDAVVAELRSWAGLSELGRESHRSLTEGEVATLASSRYVGIGAHTVNHPVLASLGADAQRDEIETSRNMLKTLTGGASVDNFAYPYGGANDYDSRTLRILSEAGVANACTTTPRPVVGGEEPLQIPRILVRDWDTAEFQQRLEPFSR